MAKPTEEATDRLEVGSKDELGGSAGDASRRSATHGTAGGSGRRRKLSAATEGGLDEEA